MRLFVTLCAAFALAGCEAQPEGEAVSRSEIGEDTVGAVAPAADATASPEPQRASACESVTFEGVELTHCVADPEEHRIRALVAPANGDPWRSFAAMERSLGQDATRVAFAMNGGMFDGEGKPIGYFVQDGERTTELNRADGEGNFHLKPNGVFFGSGGNWRVLTSERFYASVSDRPQFGTQSGPMLVVDGALHPEFQDDGPSIRIRNGVGVDGQGRAHFVISETPLSFGKLARYFRDELKTPNALYLDGTVSVLWDPPADRRDGGAPIGPILLVEDKE